MQVKVYRNLHKDCYSIQNRWSGLVVEHADTVTLLGVNFIVQPAGRAKVIETHRKNVHAFAVGERLYSNKKGAYDNTFTKLHYNPYQHDFFFTTDDKEVIGCEMLVLTSTGMYGKGLKYSKE